MKKYISYLFILAVSGTLLTSCQKDNFNYPDGYVGRSKITSYPTVTLTGGTYVAVAKGATFTDPGSVATAGGQTLKVTTAGTVNTATVGVYPVTYTAFNVDGFSSSATRYVAVYSTDASAQNNDFSGTYLRAATGVTAIWTKIGPGVYRVDNPGGAAGTNLTVITFNPTAYKITIPSQIAGGAATSSSTEVTTPGATAGTLSGYSLIILNPGYGAGVRTFTKQ
jgi:hypothetical protein